MIVVVPLGKIIKLANQLKIKKDADKRENTINKKENLIASLDDNEGKSKIWDKASL